MEFLKYIRTFIAGFCGLLVLFFCNACVDNEFDGFKYPELAIKDDSSVILGVDYTDDRQRRNFKKFLALLPQDLLEDSYFGVNWRDFLDQRWRFAVGIDAFHAAAWFEDPQFMRNVMQGLVERRGYTFTDMSDRDYWFVDDQKQTFYIVNYADLFFLAESLEEMDEIIAQLNSGGYVWGLKPVSDLNGEHFAYAYLRKKTFYPGSHWNLERFYANLSLEEDGLRLDSDIYTKMDFRDDEVIDLTDKLPGEGLVFYTGQPFLYEMDQYIFDQLTGNSGLTPAQIERILAGGFALSINDTEGYVPGVVLAFGLQKNAVDDAKRLVSAAANYFDEVIKEMDEQFKEQGGSVGAIKKEVVVKNGAGIQKLYLDWESLPKEIYDMYLDMLELDTEDLNIEFYYGVFDDSALIFAFYPNFLDSYGKNVVADNDYFVDAIANLGISDDSNDFMRTFLYAEGVLRMLNRYLAAMEGSGFSFEDQFNTDNFKNLRYIFNSAKKTPSGLKASSFFEFVQEGS